MNEIQRNLKIIHKVVKAQIELAKTKKINNDYELIDKKYGVYGRKCRKDKSNIKSEVAGK